MKIAMVASEAAPFVKTGGLGDVMLSLIHIWLRERFGAQVVWLENAFLPYSSTSVRAMLAFGCGKDCLLYTSQRRFNREFPADEHQFRNYRPAGAANPGPVSYTHLAQDRLDTPRRSETEPVRKRENEEDSEIPAFLYAGNL